MTAKFWPQNKGSENKKTSDMMGKCPMAAAANTQQNPEKKPTKTAQIFQKPNPAQGPSSKKRNNKNPKAVISAKH